MTDTTTFQPMGVRYEGSHKSTQRGTAIMADERTKALDLALSQIEKQFGKGSIMRLGSKEAIVPIAVISTGGISFDAALSVGGVPRGRVVEILGPVPSGERTFGLQVLQQ